MKHLDTKTKKDADLHLRVDSVTMSKLRSLAEKSDRTLSYIVRCILRNNFED